MQTFVDQYCYLKSIWLLMGSPWRVWRLSVELVYFLLFSTAFTAIFWTCCSFVIWFSGSPTKIAFALSRWEMTDGSTAVWHASFVRKFLILTILKRFFIAVLHMEAIWWCKRRLWSIHTPKYLMDSLYGIDSPPTSRTINLHFLICCNDPKMITSVLSEFILRQPLFMHSLTLSRQLLRDLAVSTYSWGMEELNYFLRAWLPAYAYITMTGSTTVLTVLAYALYNAG